MGGYDAVIADTRQSQTILYAMTFIHKKAVIGRKINRVQSRHASLFQRVPYLFLRQFWQL